MTSPVQIVDLFAAARSSLAQLSSRSRHALAVALLVPIVILFVSLSDAVASPIDLTLHGAPTPRPTSTKAMAEVEVTHPDGVKSNANSGGPVVFPDFENVKNDSNVSAQTAGRSKAMPKICRRDGHVYQMDDAMFASCTAQNEVERASPRRPHGKSNGASTGFSGPGSF